MSKDAITTLPMLDVLPQFKELDIKLIELLSGLTGKDWQRATVCSSWTIKDISAHLLDGTLKRLSAGRDKHFERVLGEEDLLDLVNQQNNLWTDATRRLSPNLIIEMLRIFQPQVYEYFGDLDPVGTSLYPVSWAGENSSENWFDIAREYTERWHHQQQIREALGKGLLSHGGLYSTFIRICMMGLPYHYRNICPANGSSIEIRIVGDSGGVWKFKFEAGLWTSVSEQLNETWEPRATVYLDENIAWLLWSKGIEPTQAVQYWQVIGDQQLGLHFLTMRTFIV